MKESAADRRPTLADAAQALRDGRVDVAESLCERLHSSSPDDPGPHQLAAMIALQRGRLEDAIRWARSCLALRPDHPPSLVAAGRIARASGDLAQAAKWFRRASELAPSQPEPAFLACVALLQQGDAQARALLERLLQQFPDYASGWSQIGLTLRDAGKLEAAAVALARAAKASEEPLHQMHLGAALQALGRLSEAIACFRRALETTPELIEARRALGMCLRQAGEPRLARGEFERAIAIDEGDSRLWFALGLACEDLHDVRGAIDAYRRSAQLRPEFPEAHVNLGLNLQQSGDLEAAIESYGWAVRLRPDAFGRVSQALASAKKGQLWLNLGRLRRSLGA